MPPFDQAIVVLNGQRQSLTYEEFFKLPLMQRVRMLSERQVQFFKAGQVVPASQAIK